MLGMVTHNDAGLSVKVGKRDGVVLDFVVLTNEYSLEYGATYQHEPCRLVLCS